MKNEIWKDIIGYEGLYQVSNFGRVKSSGNNKNRKEKILKPGKTKGNYLFVILTKNLKQELRYVHRLVAESFKNKTLIGHSIVVNHKDFNRQNNFEENIEIITQRENTSKKHLKSSSIYTGVSWSKVHRKWVSNIWIYPKKKFLGYFDSEIEASIVYNIELLKIK